MTDQRNANDAVINEAALARMMQRELVSSGEVADLLLDVRTLLTTEADKPSVVIETIEPVASETV